MTNSITTLSTVEKIYETQTTDQQYKRSYVLTGLFSMLSACVGVLPFGLFASSIGFLESTRILRRAAFIIGAAMLCILGLTPSVTAFCANTTECGQCRAVCSLPANVWNGSPHH